MAAPSTAYSNRVIDIKKGASVYTHYIAKIHVDEATHKAMFYLDGLVSMKLDGQEIWLGVVKQGSPNYKMHNLLRHGTIRKYKEGPSIILNDGGLNTLGKATILSNNLLWANNVRFNVNYKSARYVDTSQFGIRYRKVGSGAWTTWWVSGEGLPENTQVTSDRLFDPGLNPGDNLEVKGVLVNAEGIYEEDDSMIVSLQDRVFQIDNYYRASGACVDSGQVNVALWAKESDIEYIDTSLTTTSSATGVFLWKNIEMTVKADSGWYIGHWGDKSIYVDSSGQVTHYQLCPVSPPQISLSVEYDSELNGTVWATLSAAQSFNVTITGSIDVHPTTTTPERKEFSITILAGNIIGSHADLFVKNPSTTYYWTTFGSVPGGFVFNNQTPI